MAWISAIAAVGGDILSSSGQSAANASAQKFAMQSQLQAEQYDTQMSNTAMQRRVADLQAAGLNPLLAISQGGASTPTLSGTNANIQNPNASFGQLGQQVATAMQTDSTIKLQDQQAQQAEAQANAADAQARKTTAETPTSTPNADGTISPNHQIGDAQLAQIKAATGVSDAQARQVNANIQLIQSQTDQTKVNAALTGQNLSILQATKQYLIQQEAAKGAAASNLGGKLGATLGTINAIIQPISSAAGAAAHTAGAARMLKSAPGQSQPTFNMDLSQ